MFICLHSANQKANCLVNTNFQTNNPTTFKILVSKCETILTAVSDRIALLHIKVILINYLPTPT